MVLGTWGRVGDLDKEHPPLGWESDWWGSRGKQKIGFMGLRTGQQKKGNSGPKR